MTEKEKSIWAARTENNLAKAQKLFNKLYPQSIQESFHHSQSYDFSALCSLIESAYDKRPADLKKMDILQPSWYLEQDVVGMTLYLDLFSTDIEGFKKRVPYLKELGITFIHFMPLLETRDGQNDGGYAVKNYTQVQSRFGTTEAFIELVAQLRKNGIKSCIDFVVNHTAKENEWALKAQDGDVEYQEMYFMYDTDDIPKQFDRTVPEVFPEVSPGNFTYYPDFSKWVFTSFYEFQWDLNYRNPKVFYHIVEILLTQANMGINSIRLDAIPFMWKTLGTSCRNLPEIHDLLKLFQLIVQMVCPSVIILGEAIVEPEEIVKYYGTGEPECQLMYNATHMVNLWNALATRDTRLLQIDQSRFHIPSWSCWINYVRCHDDIGWGFNETALSHFGFSPSAHKQFLIQFYEGNFSGSFAKGELYEFNPETMDARNSGTFSSLCGLEVATKQKSNYQKELALKRMSMINSVLIASSGIPLIYSGDEVATLNDYRYLDDPNKAHDSRWLHRPFMDWERVQNRKNIATSEGLIFQQLKQMIAIRKRHDIFHSDIPMTIVPLNNTAVYCFVKQHKGQQFIGLFNFSEDRQFVDTAPIVQELSKHAYFHEIVKTDLLQGLEITLLNNKHPHTQQSQIQMGPYEFFWLT